MSVRLISCTQAADPGLTPEELIVYTARVSNPENQMNMETSERLLRYLIKHKHWSPFEMVDMTLEIKTSRAIAAQILRHRSFSFQEFSQRYSPVTTISYPDIRMQAETNRQSSTVSIKDRDLIDKVKKHIQNSHVIYNELLNNGVARESARFILPLSTETTMYMKGSVRSWIHYFDVRCHETTQKEHRDIALAARDIFSENFPTIAKALEYE